MAEYNFEDEAKLTNQQLAEDLAKRTPLTAAEIAKLLPTKVDKKRFDELLRIVNSTTAENKKVTALAENIQELGGVAIRILSRFVKPP